MNEDQKCSVPYEHPYDFCLPPSPRLLLWSLWTGGFLKGLIPLLHKIGFLHFPLLRFGSLIKSKHYIPHPGFSSVASGTFFPTLRLQLLRSNIVLILALFLSMGSPPVKWVSAAIAFGRRKCKKRKRTRVFLLMESQGWVLLPFPQEKWPSSLESTIQCSAFPWRAAPTPGIEAEAFPVLLFFSFFIVTGVTCRRICWQLGTSRPLWASLPVLKIFF